MIPKIHHKIWLGQDPVPESQRRWYKRFAELHPDWTIQIWDNAASRRLSLSHTLEFQQAKHWATKADMLRLEILLKYGGVYTDMDIEPLQSFDGLITGKEAFIAVESMDPYMVCNAVMGCELGHPFAQTLFAAVLPSMRKFVSTTEYNLDQAGPRFCLRTLKEYPNRKTRVSEVPPKLVMPYHFSQKGKWDINKTDFANVFPEAYCVHHWAQSYRT